VEEGVFGLIAFADVGFVLQPLVATDTFDDVFLAGVVYARRRTLGKCPRRVITRGGFLGEVKCGAPSSTALCMQLLDNGVRGETSFQDCVLLE
jgi:hypothetical protein